MGCVEKGVLGMYGGAGAASGGWCWKERSLKAVSMAGRVQQDVR